MFEYSKYEMTELANNLHFVRDTLEKVIRLKNVLVYLNTNPIMKNNLALKGGTAINLTIFSLPRLSVDIDLDFTNNCSRAQMMDIRHDIIPEE